MPNIELIEDKGEDGKKEGIIVQILRVTLSKSKRVASIQILAN